jgi:intracellular septation protein
MSARPVNPFLKQALELGPTILFFLLYLRIKDRSFALGGTEYSGFVVATLSWCRSSCRDGGAVVAHREGVRGCRVFTAPGWWCGSAALTAWFNDERFFKMKTTIGLWDLRGRSWGWAPVGPLAPRVGDGRAACRCGARAG